jgi:hypothetical protein
MKTTAQPPIQLYGPRGEKLAQSGKRKPRSTFSWGGSDNMIPQARQTWDRKRVPLLDQDLHRNLTKYGRKVLLSIGRHIYFSSGAVRGAVEEQCLHAAGSFMFESRSADKAWGESAERLLNRHDRMCDVAGHPCTARTWRKGMIRALYLDGDVGTVWIKGEDGQPYLQVIPSHRICSEADEVEGGEWDGYRMIDGVIVNEQNRPVAYRVLTGDCNSMDEFVDIPATSMCLHFRPVFAGQVRGLPELGLAGWDMQDLEESRRWELLAQKGAAARVFQEFNEDGEAPVGADHIIAPTSGSDTSATASGLFREVIDGGLNTYFKANSGSRLEAVKFDRPSRNQQDFAAQIWREALAGARLSVDFNLDLSKIGGAAFRLLCEKINRNHEDLRCEVLEPACRAFDFFRLGMFIESGALPAAADWFEWEYQGGAEITPDRRYDADLTAQNIRIGITTRDIRNIREQEADDLFERASKLHDKYPGLPYEIILSRLEYDFNQQVFGAAQSHPVDPEDATPDDNPAGKKSTEEMTDTED